LLEEEFQKFVTAFRAAGNNRAVEIVERLVATADDVPAELVQEQQEFWNKCAEASDNVPVADTEEFRKSCAKVEAAMEELSDINDQMMEEVGRGEFAPADATVFVMEFIRRVSGIRMS
jgi:hypothetical protein